ncbi:MAG: DsbE family thiol:disulfide interchange protein [Metallibacterium scheffleri]|jgi:cytochrome c biogenesis protein CcmG/thiol:disulfide interchange protein DsbE|uniref:DsbE family thiol:disulfide interchange protein n=1 Tax=Metallibacterium scheffleri TaxID=993689 RepID=UPI0026EBEF51|nr:DsbE family thiol:disulfide interchange protein [Metallibacterium scheffleri]MCK9365658.1 DsbE family thiol:disulfide interchange protein [Metallibacterium scheffleri]
MKLYLPLLGFLAVIGLFGFGLWWNSAHNTTLVPSPLIGKPAPDWKLPLLYQPTQTLDKTAMLGHPYVINVFASWCYVCGDEAPVLMAWGKDLGVPLIGYDYRDPRADALAWLGRHGDPYTQVVTDESGRTALNFGVYGAPETYLIDAQGIIRWKHIGPLTPGVIRDKLLPQLHKLGVRPKAAA